MEDVFTEIGEDSFWEFLDSTIFGASEAVVIWSSRVTVVTGEWDEGLLVSTFVFNWSKLENVVTVDEVFNIICWKQKQIYVWNFYQLDIMCFTSKSIKLNFEHMEVMSPPPHLGVNLPYALYYLCATFVQALETPYSKMMFL